VVKQFQRRSQPDRPATDNDDRQRPLQLIDDAR
jgi:hypothetical protein